MARCEECRYFDIICWKPDVYLLLMRERNKANTYFSLPELVEKHGCKYFERSE